MSNFDLNFISNLVVGTDNRSLDTVAKELISMKIAIGLLFQKLPDIEREAFLKTLRLKNDSYLNALADALEQFRV